MKIALKVTITIALVLLALFLFDYNCFFEQSFGIPCPGCNMFTAIYHFLKLDFQTAFYFHPAVFLLVILFIIMIIDIIRHNEFRMNFFYKLLTILMVVMVIIYIYRMINIFPDYPMKYIEDNTLNNFFKMF